jgi:large subunit ribosomal protein L21
MYAVIKSGGKQYKVIPGRVVRVERLKLEKGNKVEFDRVLAVHDDQTTTLGDPVVQNAKVIGTVLENGKAKKVIVFKYKRKKQYRVKRGHRQPYTAVQIDEIVAH